MRAVVLAVALAACGGGGKKSEPTTIGNTGGGTTASSGAAPDGAGDARVIQRSQAGGVIELIGDRSIGMQAANKEMDAHCGPGNYTIVQEGEEAVAGDPCAGGASNGAVSTRTEVAWRVHYQCNGAGPPPP